MIKQIDETLIQPVGLSATNTVILGCNICPRGVTSDLIDVELFNKIKVGALSVQVSLSCGFDTLLLKTVHHVIVGVLIR